MVSVLITNGDTHHPANWADHVLNDLVPLKPGADVELTNRVISARNALRGPVVDALTAVRTHERQVMANLTKGETELLAKVVKHQQFGGEFPGVQMIKMGDWAAKGKLRSTNDWLDDHVHKIVNTARGIAAPPQGHNEAVEAVYQVLGHYIKSLQCVERSHASTAGTAGEG